MNRDRTLEAIVAALLPAEAVVRAAAIDQPWPPLPDSEAAYVAQAVATRRAEFAAGRHLARQALDAIGCPTPALAAVATAGPIWPVAATGSISHADGLALAAVVRRQHIEALGVDIEGPRQLERAAWPDVFTSGERAELSGDSAAVALFSAKEAIYKAIAVVDRIEFVFTDFSIHPGPGNTFIARAKRADLQRALAGLTGHAGRYGERLIHIAYRRPRPANAPPASR